MSTEVSPAPSPLPDFAMPDRPSSTPLSEISENEDWRRSARISVHSLGGKPGSRPVSEVRDGAGGGSAEASKRHSASVPVHTITLSLADYAPAASARAVSAQTSALASPPLVAPAHPSSSSAPAMPRSPSARSLQSPPPRPDKPAELSARRVSSNSTHSAAADAGHAETTTDTKDAGAHPLLAAKRAALRPSPLGGLLASHPTSDALPSPTPSFPSIRESVDSQRSTPDSLPAPLGKPLTRSKPGWLKRASMAPGARTKSRSPAASDTESPPLSTSASLPPSLPPRSGMVTTTAGGPFLDRANQRGSMAPPEVPAKPASISSTPRSLLADGQGKPALAPPPLPSRDNLSNFRGRIAAWTTVSGSGAGPSSAPSSFSRSQSSHSLASSASFTPGHQRLPSSAQRVLGSAGSAVSKGWAGLRSRGVGGSISGMSSLVQSSRRDLEPGSSGWGPSASMSRKRSDEGRPPTADSLRGAAPAPVEGPVFGDGVVKRRAKAGRRSCVFGRDLTDAGRAWGVHDAAVTYEAEAVYTQRRRMCLPAIVLRTVDYLEIWGPKEEGIFRISGRSSHIAKLRAEFDAGADLDLTLCDPGDLDPHAVSGLFKMYLREMPSPLLTTALEPSINAYLACRAEERSVAQLAELVKQLPSAHWFLLADIVKLIDLIPRHASVNRMSHQALMLSLGPTLRLSGDMLDLFIRHRLDLFTDPPELSLVESTSELIDFGDVDITPPSIPEADDAGFVLGDAPIPPPKARKLPPRLPKKPSLSRLLSASGSMGNMFTASLSSSSLTKRGSNDGMQSPAGALDAAPPRVDLPRTPEVELPSFGGEPAVAPENATSESRAGSTGDTEDLVSEPPASAPPVPAKFADMMGDAHYAPGTVEERTRAFTLGATPAATSTPIADRFRRTSAAATPLRTPRSSTHSSPASPKGAAGALALPDSPTRATSARPAADLALAPAPPTNPIALIRRGPPIFFQSAIATERHARSLSAAPAPASIVDTPVTGAAAGVKRKEDKEQAPADDGRQSPAKRLSAGPGIIGASEQEQAAVAGAAAGADERAAAAVDETMEH